MGYANRAVGMEDVERGKLRAESLTLVFKDGEIYEAPYSDPLPLTVDLAELPAGESSVVYYAALPALNSRGGNVARADVPGAAIPHSAARFAQFGQTPIISRSKTGASATNRS